MPFLSVNQRHTVHVHNTASSTLHSQGLISNPPFFLPYNSYDVLDLRIWYWIKLCLLSVTYPLDVVRRRMQMKGISGDLFAYTSTKHAFTTIVQVEGVKGLYKGMWPNLLKVTLESHHHEILNSKRGGGLLLGILGSGLLLSLVLQLKSSQPINFTHKLLTKL